MMMRSRRWAAVAFWAVVLGCPLVAGAQGWTQVQPSDKVENGVNWSTQMIYASGRGAASDADLKRGPAYARIRALTAAMAVAQAELLTVIKGVQVDSEKVINDQMVASDVVRTRVQGFIQGARPVEEKDLGGGVWEVTLAIRATGQLADLVLPQGQRQNSAPAPMPSPTPQPMPQAPTPPPAPPQAIVAPPAPAPAAPAPSKTQVAYSGLVVDARGLGVKPAMAPKVLSEGGQEVYGNSVVDRNWLVQQGMADYSKDLAAAQAKERVTNRPLTVKAISASGTTKTDVVISNADAQLLLGSGANLGFLEKARVVFVVD
jgi:hypothetical protein